MLLNHNESSESQHKINKFNLNRILKDQLFRNKETKQ